MASTTGLVYGVNALLIISIVFVRLEANFFAIPESGNIALNNFPACSETSLVNCAQLQKKQKGTRN